MLLVVLLQQKRDAPNGKSTSYGNIKAATPDISQEVNVWAQEDLQKGQ